ncbi:MAG: T9SS type A sorting domain-containing protein, partial [Paludibacter sp.]|nr:T9SS type A sorting domain-containing protein [Paludibacter sp.]
GTATFINNGTANIAVVNVEQFINTDGGREYFYLASPVSGATNTTFGNDLATDYVEASHAYNAAYTELTPLVSGKGYVSNHTGSDTTYTFSGTLTESDVTVNLTYTGISDRQRGFNLIGNPYPAYINWAALFPTNIIEPTIWYPDGFNEFTTVNATSGESVPAGASAVVPPEQAFWVRVAGNLPTTTNITLTKNLITTDSHPLYVPNSTRQVLRLNISNTQNTDQNLFVFNSNATLGFDAYDSRKMNNEQTPKIYTMADDIQLVINGIPAVVENQEIALGVKIGSNETYTIAAAEIENISQQVILLDKVLNTEFDLSAGNSYEFTSTDAGDNTSRFAIVFRSPNAITQIDGSNLFNIYVNKQGKITVSFDSKNYIGQSFRLYDATGKMLVEQRINNTITEIQGNYCSGVYLLNVNQKTVKIIVNN